MTKNKICKGYYNALYYKLKDIIAIIIAIILFCFCIIFLSDNINYKLLSFQAHLDKSYIFVLTILCVFYRIARKYKKNIFSLIIFLFFLAIVCFVLYDHFIQ